MIAAEDAELKVGEAGGVNAAAPKVFDVIRCVFPSVVALASLRSASGNLSSLQWFLFHP